MTSPTPSAVADDKDRLRLRLYVAAESPNSVAAIANLRAALAEYPELHVELEVIDILQDPERGLLDAITVTPMLVKVEPLPVRRILGNLRDRCVLLGALGLDDGDARVTPNE